MKPPLNTSQDPERIAARLRAMFKLFDDEMEKFRNRLRREMPDATEEDIRRKVAEFLHADQPMDETQFRKRAPSESRFASHLHHRQA